MLVAPHGRLHPRQGAHRGWRALVGALITAIAVKGMRFIKSKGAAHLCERDTAFLYFPPGTWGDRLTRARRSPSTRAEVRVLATTAYCKVCK